MEIDALFSDGAESLQRFSLFQRLSFEETNALARLARRVRHPEGTVLVEEGALGNALHLIVGGVVRVERKVPEGADAESEFETLGVLGGGDLFGEMSLVDDLLTSARVVAVDEVELLTIDRAPFEKLLGEDDRLAAKVYRAFCQELSEKLRDANAALAGRGLLLV